ncbi:hypothetical protein [Streptomyces sp. NPDC000880]
MINEAGARLGAEAAQQLARTELYRFEPGLTEAKFARIEGEYGFEFADDHRAFLAAGLPVNTPPEEGQTWTKPWPEWRGGDPDKLRAQLRWPVEGVLFDVKHGFWYEAWGERPADETAALATARQHLADVPVMVPVYCFTDGAGRPWTLAGAATISDRSNRFVGEVPEWSPRWHVSGNNVTAPLMGAGILRRLGQGRKPLDSTLRRRIPSFNPLQYWPMEDEDGATRAASALTRGGPLYTLGMAFGSDCRACGMPRPPTRP